MDSGCAESGSVAKASEQNQIDALKHKRCQKKVAEDSEYKELQL